MESIRHLYQRLYIPLADIAPAGDAAAVAVGQHPPSYGTVPPVAAAVPETDPKAAAFPAASAEAAHPADRGDLDAVDDLAALAEAADVEEASPADSVGVNGAEPPVHLFSSPVSSEEQAANSAATLDPLPSPRLADALVAMSIGTQFGGTTRSSPDVPMTKATAPPGTMRNPEFDRFSRVIAFCPTGWAYVGDGRPPAGLLGWWLFPRGVFAPCFPALEKERVPGSVTQHSSSGW